MGVNDWVLQDLTSVARRTEALREAEVFLSQSEFNSLSQNLDWQLGVSERWGDGLLFLYRSAPRGMAAFIRRDWPVSLMLGEISLASVTMQRLVLVGDPIIQTHDDRLATQAIRDLLDVLVPRLGRRMAIFFEGLPIAGPTYSLLSAPEILKHFIPLPTGRRFLHHYIRLPESYGEYLKQLGSRSRKSIQYSARKLEKTAPGQVKVSRFDDAGSVARFAEDAARVSRSTYQWNLLGLGLRDRSSLERRLIAAAERNWLRSYILYVGDTPISFILGYQYLGCYYYIDTGYDPSYTEFSPGSILQLAVIEDLYAGGETPSLFDFSTGHGPHKERFGNFAREEINILLLPKSAENRAIAAAFRAISLLSSGASSILDRLGLKDSLKKLIRRRASGR